MDDLARVVPDDDLELRPADLDAEQGGGRSLG
jgi:hypothetical protein